MFTLSLFELVLLLAGLLQFFGIRFLRVFLSAGGRLAGGVFRPLESPLQVVLRERLRPAAEQRGKPAFRGFAGAAGAFLVVVY